jgi:hypothetical protein
MYNKVELIRLLRSREKWDIRYNTFFFWQKKGFIKNKHNATYVGRIIPMYDEKDYAEIVGNLTRLNSEGKIRIKVLTQ